jgi:hypothetical protein
MFFHLIHTQTLKLTPSRASEEESPATLLILTLRISPPLLGSYRLHLLHQQIAPPPHFPPDLSTQRASRREQRQRGRAMSRLRHVAAARRGVHRAGGRRDSTLPDHHKQLDL